MSNPTKSSHLSSLKTKPLNRKVSREIIGHELPAKVFEMIFLPAVNDKIKNELLVLLRWSELLDYDDKLKIIDCMPTLTASEIEGFISVFNEELEMFNEIKGDENVVPGNDYLELMIRRDSDWVELKRTLLRRLLSE